MALETGVSFLNDLVSTNPVTTDVRSEGDDHLRNIKTALQATFPGLAGRAWRSQTKTINYTLLATDNLTLINIATTGLTVALTAAATLGNGFLAFVFANGFDVTVDPNAAETINGAATLTVPNGYVALILSNGTSFTAFLLNKTGAALLGADDNYVTDAEKIVIGNTSGVNTGDQTNISGNAATVTTNANLTGHVTSVGNAAVLGSFTLAQLNAAISDADIPSGSGAMVLLSTVTASNSATVDIETTFSSTYDSYLLVASGVTVGTDSVSLNLRMKLSGSYVTTGTYGYSRSILRTDGADTTLGVGAAGETATEIPLTDATVVLAGLASANFDINIHNPASTAFVKKIRWRGDWVTAASSAQTTRHAVGVGLNQSTGALTGIRIYASTGNIVAGKFRLYGIANS